MKLPYYCISRFDFNRGKTFPCSLVADSGYGLDLNEIIVVLPTYPESYYKVDRRSIMSDDEQFDPAKEAYEAKNLMNEADMLKYTIIPIMYFRKREGDADRLQPNWYSKAFIDAVKEMRGE